MYCYVSKPKRLKLDWGRISFVARVWDDVEKCSTYMKLCNTVAEVKSLS